MEQGKGVVGKQNASREGTVWKSSATIQRGIGLAGKVSPKCHIRREFIVVVDPDGQDQVNITPETWNVG